MDQQDKLEEKGQETGIRKLREKVSEENGNKLIVFDHDRYALFHYQHTRPHPKHDTVYSSSLLLDPFTRSYLACFRILHARVYPMSNIQSARGYLDTG